ncbi:hypothetical protein JTE90_006362 [Oedothorax gibbosus]|uniref:Uncharacterized protein n=1 Tax=Oedothorax gibbosus TaxID=931172 RepID=A0AAV6VXH0_9ARAC|nr:hypothetical protein JTE90_006362 [Oedothorax gibbosus]
MIVFDLIVPNDQLESLITQTIPWDPTSQSHVSEVTLSGSSPLLARSGTRCPSVRRMRAHPIRVRRPDVTARDLGARRTFPPIGQIRGDGGIWSHSGSGVDIGFT